MSATIVKLVEIRCDKSGCDCVILDGASTMTAARRAATSAGWSCTVILPAPNSVAVPVDLCPEHADYPITLAEVRPSGKPARSKR